MAASFILRTASDCFTVTPVIAGNISRILRSMNIDYFAMQLTTDGFLPVQALHTASLFKQVEGFKYR